MSGRTLVASSLIDSDQPGVRGTPLEISTIADTWLHLEAVDGAGERNRSLCVIKSRGTSHSLQVREMLLSDDGIDLADVYTGSGEVLMGTLRRQREHEDRLTAEHERAERERQQALLEAEAAQIEAEFELMRRRLDAKRLEIGTIERERKSDAEADEARRQDTFRMRGGEDDDDG
jgi:circadian clock protein KaiC